MYYNGTAEIYNAWMNGMYELLFWYALIALAYLLIIGLIWGIVVQKLWKIAAIMKTGLSGDFSSIFSL